MSIKKHECVLVLRDKHDYAVRIVKLIIGVRLSASLSSFGTVPLAGVEEQQATCHYAPFIAAFRVFVDSEFSVRRMGSELMVPRLFVSFWLNWRPPDLYLLSTNVFKTTSSLGRIQRA